MDGAKYIVSDVRGVLVAPVAERLSHEHLKHLEVVRTPRVLGHLSSQAALRSRFSRTFAEHP